MEALPCGSPPDAIDELGPVDWIVVEFPGSSFDGQIAPVLTDLVDRSTVRILDLLLIRTTDVDGTLEFAELDDGEVGQLRAFERALAMVLNEHDVRAVADAVEAGSTAALLVWENTWAAPFFAADRHAGGPAGGQRPHPPCRRRSP